MRVLVVDDAPDVVESVRLGFTLQWRDVEVLGAATGEEALDVVEREHPDIVLLDVGLPGMDGFGALREIRVFSDVPVVMLTARDDAMDKVKGLELGADDYVTKPFNHLELMARVRAVLRRHDMPPPTSRAPSFRAAELEVDFARQEARLRGERLDLTPTEYKILYHLVRNAGHILQHGTLLAKVWGREYLDEVTTCASTSAASGHSATTDHPRYIRRARPRLPVHRCGRLNMATTAATPPDAAARRFPLRVGRRSRPLLRLFGVRDGNAWVDLGQDELVARFGRFVVRTPVADVVRWRIEGPWRWITAIGVRRSIRHGDITFGGTRRGGVRIDVRTPLRLGPFRPTALYVTVEDLEASRPPWSPEAPGRGCADGATSLTRRRGPAGATAGQPIAQCDSVRNVSTPPPARRQPIVRAPPLAPPPARRLAMLALPLLVGVAVSAPTPGTSSWRSPPSPVPRRGDGPGVAAGRRRPSFLPSLAVYGAAFGAAALALVAAFPSLLLAPS